MRKTWLAAAALFAVAGIGDALAQAAPRDTLVVLRGIDSDLYDPARATATAAGEVIHMMSDTLVSLDWDLKTVRPGLAESWTVSDDGRLYTFKIREDVTFCGGRRLTAEDIAYSLRRWADPATRSPVRWRAGPVKEIRATGPYTLEYELNEPFSELLHQLTLYFASVVDKETVERLGANFGTQGFVGTGPYCWKSWTPRQQLVLTRHPDYRWGPPIYQNPAPQIGRVIWRIIPEDTTRLAALQTGQGDVLQAIPLFALDGLKATPGIKLSNQPANLVDYFLGFRVDKPVMNDPVIRRAANMAVDRDALSKAFWFGHAAAMDSYINPGARDADPDAKVAGLDIDGANRLLDEAGWARGSDGIRAKDGQRASFLLYGINNAIYTGLGEAIQADLRRIGIEVRVQLFDATVAWGKLATQEFDAFLMSYPYLTAADGLSLYFSSANRPTPNRMNWNDPQTDKWLAEARATTDDAARQRALSQLQRHLAAENPWLPLVRTPLWLASSPRTEGVRAHGIYALGLYKGLDIRLTR